jgi:hypothetical protein
MSNGLTEFNLTILWSNNMNITNSQLNALSVDELTRLNRMVVAMIKTKHADDNRTAIYSFRAGDRVKFSSPRSGVSYTGEVTEVKRTKVVVKTPAGNYLVPASMLNKCA